MQPLGWSVALAAAAGLVSFYLLSVLIRSALERLNQRKVRKVMQNFAPGYLEKLAKKAAEEKATVKNDKRTKPLAQTRTKRASAQPTTPKAQGFMGYFVNQIQRGGLDFSPKVWMVVQVTATGVLFVVVLLINSNFVVALISSLVFGVVAPKVYVALKFSKRLLSFETELPETLMLVASALRSGLSFQQALEATVSERDSELGIQMRQAINETRLGTPLEESLERVAERMRSEDLRWLVAAIEIQREVGGTLSTILDTAAATIKGREELRREVRSLSAEGRLSAYVLVGLPAGIFMFLFISRPEYVSFFWTDLLGIVMLILVLIMIGLGWLWMSRMVKIKV